MNDNIVICAEFPSTEFLNYVLELEKSGKEIRPYATSGIWPENCGLLKVDNKDFFCITMTPGILDRLSNYRNLILDRGLSLQYLIDTGIYEHIKDFESVRFFGPGTLEEEINNNEE